MCIGCTSEKSIDTQCDQIKIDMLSITEKPLFLDFDYIRLETQEDCLISYIDKILVVNRYLIIHSVRDRAVVLFDREGKYVRKFTNGQGPDDLIYPVDISYDEKNDRLWILDYYSTFREFTMEGKCINTIKNENAYMRLQPYNGSLLLFTANMTQKSPYLFEFIKNKQSVFFVEKDERFNNAVYIPTTSFCPVNDSIVFFYHQFEDRIYSWNEQTMKADIAYEVIYQNGRSIANWKGEGELGTGGRNSEYQKLIDNREYIFGISNLYCLSDVLFFTVKDNTRKYCLYEMKNRTLQLYQDLISGLPDLEIIELFTGENNTILFALSPDAIQNYIDNMPDNMSINKNFVKLKKMSEELNEDDNPVIIISKNRQSPEKEKIQ
jgi:hypothetical protein